MKLSVIYDATCGGQWFRCSYVTPFTEGYAVCELFRGFPDVCQKE